jgi:hexosaminidase
MLRRVEERTGLTFARLPDDEYVLTANATGATLVVQIGASDAGFPSLGNDESYTLEINATQAILRAPTTWGALHGLATVQQLLRADASGWFLPAVSIEDRPRFSWRGLLIDVGRHWQPLEVIQRNLDGMALVKLNVLHLHLTEDQGFRIESRQYPHLHELGSDGHYFTQEQMRGLVAYAADRGIRVVPEFDLPGHATSWVVAYPDLASAPGPYVIERKWGVFDPVLDPTNPKVYELLGGFLGEMAALFPDTYLHIGGDENNGVQWNANPKIQAFIREHNLKDNAGLHAYFNTKLNAILTRNGKTLVGWDEVLHPDLPPGSVVHSWRGPEGIAAATKLGFPVLLSNGYYIDLCHPAAELYWNDPLPAGNRLTPAQRELVLGGEATMWAEWVTPETIDSRIWPRTAAIAERLWSPSEVRDVPDMYRRLAVVSRRLEDAGLQHESFLDPALRRLAGDGATPAGLATLRSFVDLLEPVKDYRRGEQQPAAVQATPLNSLVDCARPDSEPARTFAALAEPLVSNSPATAESLAAVRAQLFAWKGVRTILSAGVIATAPRLAEARPLLESLATACDIGEESLQLLEAGRVPADGWLTEKLTRLTACAEPHAAAELPMVPTLRLLAAAASEQGKRGRLSAEEWRQHLDSILTPPAKSAAP